MRSISLLFCTLCLFSFVGCTERTVNTSTIPYTEIIKAETVVPETQIVAQIDLSPFTEISVGQAIVSHVKEVNSVTVTKVNSGEVAYESEDELLAQSFYDAIQIVDKKLEDIDSNAENYEICFITNLGLEKIYSLWIDPNETIPVHIKWEEKHWELPVSESNFIRNRINGLI